MSDRGSVAGRRTREPGGPFVTRRDVSVSEAAVRTPAPAMAAPAYVVGFDDVYRRGSGGLGGPAALLGGSRGQAGGIVPDALAPLFLRGGRGCPPRGGPPGGG